MAALLGGGAAWLGTVEHLVLLGTFDLCKGSPQGLVKSVVETLTDAAPSLPSLTSLRLCEPDIALRTETMSQLKLAFPRVLNL